MADCELCQHAIVDDLATNVRGVTAHRACLLRSAVGGIGHLLDHQHFCKDGGDPDAGLDYYVSARLVHAYVNTVGIEVVIDNNTLYR